MVSLPEYSPPETLRGDHLAFDGAKSDVWSCGIILYMMLTGSMPFRGGDGPAGRRMPTMARAIMRCSYGFPAGTSVSLTVQDLLARIFVPIPEDRISLDQMLRHPWLAPCNVLQQTRAITNQQQPAILRQGKIPKGSLAERPTTSTKHSGDGGTLVPQEVEDIRAVLARARQRRLYAPSTQPGWTASLAEA